jgi:hypothetical protein
MMGTTASAAVPEVSTLGDYGNVVSWPGQVEVTPSIQR